MSIRISPRAEKAFKRLPKFDQIALTQKIRTLVGNKIPAEEKLSGFPHCYRVRVGNYRIVYKRTTHEVYIILIGHRRDIYRKLAEWLG